MLRESSHGQLPGLTCAQADRFKEAEGKLLILLNLCFRNRQLMQEFSDKLTRMRQLLQECTAGRDRIADWWAHQQSNTSFKYLI